MRSLRHHTPVAMPAGRRIAGRRAGAALVEAAIVMNIFMMFMFAVMEFGHYVMIKQIVDNAAREGARLASTGTAILTTTDITNAVKGRLAGQVPNNLNIQVFQADPQTGANIGSWNNAGLGSAIAVRITGTYKPMVSLVSVLSTSVPLTAQCIVYSESVN